MRSLSIFIIALFIVGKTECKPAGGLVDQIQDAGGDIIGAVVNPVGKAVSGTVLKNFGLILAGDVIKGIFGVGFDQVKEFTPQEAQKLNLELWYGKNNKVVFNITGAAEKMMNDPNFDPDRPIAIFLHGFTSNTETDTAQGILEALMLRNEVNALALDSSSFIQFLYLRSSSLVKYIGEELGKELVSFLNAGIPAKHIHLIGHSLGAHISGFAGQTFKNITGEKIGRISGLDPAGPCFFRKTPEFRLSKNDAKFLDVIHTDAGVFGMNDPLGHVDFFPNNGEQQPSCALPTCSHGRAPEFFAESIIDLKAFPAVECPGWDTFKSASCEDNELAYMGYGVDPRTRGIFYLRTGASKPYGLKDEGWKKPKTGFLGIGR